MADDKLKLSQEGMRAQASELKSAVSAYKNFGKNPFDKEIGYIEGMNTDFLAKFKTMLEDLNDSNIKIVKRLEELQEIAEEIVDNFEEVDQSAAESLGIK